MRGVALAGLLVLGMCGCGQTESDSGGAGTGGSAAGAGGSGGSGAVSSGGAGGSVAQGGSGGGGGSGGSAGAGAAGGVAGAGASGGAGGECAGLDYCACRDRTDCAIQAEPCFCPCGVEPCEPSCACECGGGMYLGCTPASVMSPGTLEGIWLIGWAGGLNHFSWVRISSGGVAEFLDGADLYGNAPIWCSGAGSWIYTAKPETVGLYLPSACTGFEPLTFEAFTTPPSWVKGSILVASVSTGIAGQYYEAYKFPPSQCDAAMTSCADPFL